MMNILKIFLRLINPIAYFQAYRTWRAKKRRLAVSEFAHKHKHLLIIVLDPVTDELYMSYRDHQVLNKIKTVDGKNHHIVKRVLKASQFRSRIDQLIVALVEALKTPLNIPEVNHFIKWIDGALFNIVSDVQEDEKKEKVINPK